ncbi:MAG: hypothetical protein ACPGVF_01935 [Flavobacteriaceae bacterium]
MIERIKNLMQDLANEIIDAPSTQDPLLWKEKAKSLHELLSIYVFLRQENKRDATWETHESHLKDAVAKLENVSFTSQQPVQEMEEEDRSVPPLMDTINDILTEMPDQGLSEELFQEVVSPPVFEKKQPLDKKQIGSQSTHSKNLNDRFSKSLKIDLNDRIAFIKHLFNNQREDYQRVIQQMMTYSTWKEAHKFIKEMVKPEYNHWEGKEAYETRFLSLVELHFEEPA